MSLKDRIGTFQPTSATYGKVDWKDLRIRKILPFTFYFRFKELKEGINKSGENYEMLKGVAELDTSNLTEGQILDRVSATDIPTDRPIEVSFFIVGSMMISQIQKSLNAGLNLGFADDDKDGLTTIDWRKLGIGKLFHIRYMGKVKIPDSTKEFHQIWVSLVPEPEAVQVEL